MCGAIPPLPQYALMAWCSVKTQGQLYLYTTLRHSPELRHMHYTVMFVLLGVRCHLSALSFSGFLLHIYGRYQTLVPSVTVDVSM